MLSEQWVHSSDRSYVSERMAAGLTYCSCQFEVSFSIILQERKLTISQELIGKEFRSSGFNGISRITMGKGLGRMKSITFPILYQMKKSFFFKISLDGKIGSRIFFYIFLLLQWCLEFLDLELIFFGEITDLFLDQY